MPPLFSTTSPVAVAASRILAAYLSNHKLSPAEAAGLSRTIAETLANLAAGAEAESDSSVGFATEPAARRRAQPRRSLTVVAEDAVALELPQPEPVLEPEPAAPVALANSVPAEMYGLELEPAPQADPDIDPFTGAVTGADIGADIGAEAGAWDSQGSPPKRKRPSRPRSKRGGRAIETAASEASAEMGPEDGGPEDAGPPAAREEIVAGWTLSEPAAESPPSKPRRATTRARRVTAR